MRKLMHKLNNLPKVINCPVSKWQRQVKMTGLTLAILFTHHSCMLSHFSHVQLCATPDGSPPGSPVPGILQARTLEWVAISFSNA